MGTSRSPEAEPIAMATPPARRLLPALILALGAVSALPSAAGAATLTANYAAGELSYAAAPGELNLITATSEDGQVKLSDDGVGAVTLTQIGVGDCKATTARRVRCGGLSHVSVDLSDAVDVANLEELAVPATVVAGDGAKTISTGAGDDRIFVRNGSVDSVSCGAGKDVVVADPVDAVAADCETGGGGAPPTGGDDSGAEETPTPESTADPTAPTGSGGDDSSQPPAIGAPIGIVLPDAPVTVSDSGTARVPLACAAAGTTSCRGDLTIRARVIAAHKVRSRSIGHRHFKLRRGDKVELPVRIHYRGHYTLATRRHRGRARIVVVQRDAAGKPVSVTSRSVTIVVAKHRWSRRRRHR
jgi:hypothetical protein